MKRLWIFIFLFSTLLTVSLEAGVHRIRNGADSGDASLRAALMASCYYAGDDEILFAPTTSDQFRITVRTPLEIPADCNGAVTIIGSVDKETVLDGSGIESGDGILIVRSWGNTIRNFTFVGYERGSGLVIEDSDNVIEDSVIHSNRVGLLISGDWNLIRGNTISGNLEEGLLIAGHANDLKSNRIGDRAGTCPSPTFPNPSADLFPAFVREIIHEAFEEEPSDEPGADPSDLCGNGGAGIRISGDRNLIGGDEIAEGNRIFYNRGDGIVVEQTGSRNRFSRNQIASNDGSGIQLEGGANNGIETLSVLKAFPVESEPFGGTFRYTLFGQGAGGTRIELYQVATDEEGDRGEGAKFLEWFDVGEGVFTRTLEFENLPPGSRITALVCDDLGNCSEFSPNAALGRDSDHDGLLDPTEDTDGDLVVDEEESDPLLNDSDGDGLPDPVEDRNENGRLDTGETDAAAMDTDDDGISDFVETGGDGNVDPADRDTDPRDPDTDGDGLTDGEEDLNADGIVVVGERDPLAAGW